MTELRLLIFKTLNWTFLGPQCPILDPTPLCALKNGSCFTGNVTCPTGLKCCLDNDCSHKCTEPALDDGECFTFQRLRQKPGAKLHPNISMHILPTVLFAFLKVLTGRICLTIESSSSWSSLRYSRDLNLWFKSDIVIRN